MPSCNNGTINAPELSSRRTIPKDDVHLWNTFGQLNRLCLKMTSPLVTKSNDDLHNYKHQP